MHLSVPLIVIAGVLSVLSGAASGIVFAQELVAVPGELAPAADADQLVHAADLALRGERLVEAQALFERLQHMSLDDRQRDDVALLRAEFMVATGRLGEARPLLETLGAAAREQCRVVAALATADIRMDAFASADRDLRAAQGRCADDPVYWRALGQASLGLQSSSAAVDAYRRALILDPGNHSLQNDLAVALVMNGRAAEAVGLLTAVLRNAPDREDVAINLDYAGAALGQVPRRRPADDDAFWSRRLQYAGAGARSAGRVDLAEALFAQALMQRPKHDEALWQQYAEVAQQ
jgi:tetratricopeptide (TPR) repeat protein